jgi:serine/threonine-protein kinase RsbW
MEQPTHQRFTAELKNLATMRHFVERAAINGGGDPDAIGDMLLAMNEATTNIILHGYQDQPGDIEIEVAYDGNALMVTLRDQSTAFDPTSVPPPDLTLPLEQRSYGGMGIHMMRQFTDEIIYRTKVDWSNELILVKKEARKL